MLHTPTPIFPNVLLLQPQRLTWFNTAEKLESYESERLLSLLAREDLCWNVREGICSFHRAGNFNSRYIWGCFGMYNDIMGTPKCTRIHTLKGTTWHKKYFGSHFSAHHPPLTSSFNFGHLFPVQLLSPEQLIFLTSTFFHLIWKKYAPLPKVHSFRAICKYVGIIFWYLMNELNWISHSWRKKEK